MEEDFVEINGEKIKYYYKRKKIKNLILRLNENGDVIVSIPMKTPLRDVHKFILKETKWINKKKANLKEVKEKRENLNFENGDNFYFLGKVYSLEILKSSKNYFEILDEKIVLGIKEKYKNDKKYIEKVYKKFLKEKALEIFKRYVSEYYEIMKDYGIPNPEVSVKCMKTRWGYCVPSKNKVCFSLNLIKTDEDCIRYVVVHELSHFKYQNHSKDFYNFVSIFIKDWKEKRNILNKKYTKLF